MATSDALKGVEFDEILSSSIFDTPKGGKIKSRGALIEKKIDFLENLSGKICTVISLWRKPLVGDIEVKYGKCDYHMVSNRRSRRWLNDRLLIELVPRLDAEEIRGLFAPPPWGDSVPLSPFCMTNVGEWDSFRNVDMDKETSMIKALEGSLTKKKGRVDAEKIAALGAWHRVDCRTREALRRSFLSELIEGYEQCLREFITGTGEADILVLHVQDPFHRLLLHGVCEFYDLLSITDTRLNDGKLLKATRIQKKKSGSASLPEIPLSLFLKMLKEGLW